MLDDHGKYSIGRGKRIEQENMRTHHGKMLIKAFKEADDKILLVVSLCRARTRRQRAIVI